jgi:hypothetical protein
MQGGGVTKGEKLGERTATPRVRPGVKEGRKAVGKAEKAKKKRCWEAHNCAEKERETLDTTQDGEDPLTGRPPALSRMVRFLACEEKSPEKSK